MTLNTPQGLLTQSRVILKLRCLVQDTFAELWQCQRGIPWWNQKRVMLSYLPVPSQILQSPGPAVTSSAFFHSFRSWRNWLPSTSVLWSSQWVCAFSPPQFPLTTMTETEPEMKCLFLQMKLVMVPPFLMLKRYFQKHNIFLKNCCIWCQSKKTNLPDK